MKTLLAILLLPSFQVICQPVPDERTEVPESESAGAPDISSLSSPGLDSLYRRLASIEVAKAREEAASKDFWHRLIPHLSVEGGIGLRDLAFPDAGGAVVLPKDSYRLTLELSLSELFDGSAHAGAELHLEETETRLSLLIEKQRLARLGLTRKMKQLTAELAALKDELSVRESAVSCQELLFAQGRVDFHAVAGARVDLIRLKQAAALLESRIRELRLTLPGERAE